MDLGLSRVTRLVREYNKVLPWKAFHIAGTNGKGSTSAFLSGFLHKAGVKVGRFNSPHLKYRHDCISINEETISRSLFDDIEKEIKKRDEDLGTKATSFELLTATAFEAFNRAEIDVGVVECGLGGTHDATNILLPEEVCCSIITRIGLDHQDLLGKSVIDIAQAKAGIIKPGVPVVIISDERRDVSNVITERAAKLNSSYAFSSYDKTSLKASSEELKRILDLPLSMLNNLTVAYDAYTYISSRQPLNLPPLSSDAALEVAKSIRKAWRGRNEWLSIEQSHGRKSSILLDGAHNPQALGMLRKYVDEHVSNNFDKPAPVTWVFAASKGKDLFEMFNGLFQAEDTIIMTEFSAVDGMPWVRCEAASVLQDLAKRNMENYAPSRQGDASQDNIFSYPIPSEALSCAVKVTPETSPIVVTGSLYLVGTVLRMLDT